MMENMKQEWTTYLDEMIMMGNVLCTIYTDGVRLVHRWFGQP